MRKTVAMLLCVVLVVSMFVGCGNSAQPSEPNNPEPAATNPPAEVGSSSNYVNEGETPYERKTPEDSIVIATPEEPANLDPADCQLVSAYAIVNGVYDRLIVMDAETGEYVNLLAESVEYTDDVTLEIKIKSGIQFSNGTPLTAEDVLFTFQHLAESNRFSSNFSCIDFENTTVNDETSLTVKLLAPYAPFLSYVANPACGIISKAYYEEVGADAFGRNPMGSGPFVFVSWESGDRVTLTRNDNFWGELPAYKDVVVRFITESTTRMIEFETGGVDVAMNLASADIERMLNGDVPNSTLYTSVSENIQRIGLLDSFEPFKDYRVRQALAHAIDMETVVEVAWGSGGVVTGNIYPEDCKFFEKFDVYSYDPELAKSLLEEAGYADGFELTGVAIAASPEAKAMELIQAMLSEVGVTLQFETTEHATVISKMLHGEVNFAILNSTTNTRDPDQAISNMRAASPFLIAATSDPELNEYFDTGSTVVDEDVRREAYQSAARYIYDNAITIPVCTTVYGTAVRDYVDFYEILPSNTADLRTITFK